MSLAKTSTAGPMCLATDTRQSRRLPTSADSLHGRCGLSTSRAVHPTRSGRRFVPDRRPSLTLSQPRANKSGPESRRATARRNPSGASRVCLA
jgi:hypothetical protein